MKKINIDTISSRVKLYSEDSKNIFFGVDGGFINHSLITMMSLVENAKSLVYQFHIISSDVQESEISQYIKTLSGSRHGLTIHHTGCNLFESLPTTELFPQAIYYRLLAPLLVPDAEQILYLDADMVCISSPEALWSYPVIPEEIALVVSENDNVVIELAKSAGLEKKQYFNAGMMLINVKQWNMECVSENAFHILNTSTKRLQYLDQDALNIVLENHVRYIDNRFNYINMLAHDDKGYLVDIPEDVCIIHYAGADKPWQEWNQQKTCQYYRNIYHRSPIAEHPFEMPKNNQQAKKMYKTMFRSCQFLRGVYWLIRYYQMRYF
jgi:lipopolysaccharide biosynthesis glycosyltransferase